MHLIAEMLQLLVILIVVRALSSWLPISRTNPWLETLYYITDPFLRPFQMLVPPERLGGMDISPILAIFAINFLISLLNGG